jgi:hypothetical protein
MTTEPADTAPTPIPNGTAVIYLEDRGDPRSLLMPGGGHQQMDRYKLGKAVMLTWGPTLSVVWVPDRSNSLTIMPTSDVSLPEDENGPVLTRLRRDKEETKLRNEAARNRRNELFKDAKRRANATGLPVELVDPDEAPDPFSLRAGRTLVYPDDPKPTTYAEHKALGVNPLQPAPAPGTSRWWSTVFGNNS